ncbi:MAG: relaxase/mobilization nuclease domain-containing protein [Rikenellaceae bacterium]
MKKNNKGGSFGGVVKYVMDDKKSANLIDSNGVRVRDLGAKIAREYMMRMGILDTQYIVGRHHDKMHPHCHIIFNRVDNYGRRITDSNDRLRSEKICKELTRKHGLYFADGKEKVKRHRLRGKDPLSTKSMIHWSKIFHCQSRGRSLKIGCDEMV